ncbi:MAG: hypothetical protein ACREQA_19715 [Candidatus Binatia bacterium]
MAIGFILIVAEAWFHTMICRRKMKNQASRARHRSDVRASWTVYIRRYWHGAVQTHRAWADMGMSVWDLVSVDTARKYGRQEAVA